MEEAETNSDKQEQGSKHHSSSGKQRKKRKKRKRKVGTVIKADPSPSPGKPSLDDKASPEDVEKQKAVTKARVQDGEQRNQGVRAGKPSSPRAANSSSRQDPLETSKTSSKLHSQSKSQDTMAKDKMSNDAAVKDRSSSKDRQRSCRPESSKDRQRSCSPESSKDRQRSCSSKDNVNVIPQPAGEQSGPAAAPKGQTTNQARREQDTAGSLQEEAETNSEKQEQGSKHHSSSGKQRKKHKNRKRKVGTVIKADPSPSSGKPSLDDKALPEDVEKQKAVTKARVQDGEQRNQGVRAGKPSSPRAANSSSRQDPLETSKTSSKLHSQSKSQDTMAKDKMSNDAAVKDRSSSKDRQRSCSPESSKDRQRSCSPESSKDNVNVIPQPAGEQSRPAAAPKGQTTNQARREQDTAGSLQEEAETNSVEQEQESKRRKRCKNRKPKEDTVIKADPSPSSGKPSLDDKALPEDVEKQKAVIKARVQDGEQRNQGVRAGKPSSPRAANSSSRQDPLETSKTSSKLHSQSKSQDTMAKDKMSNDAAVKDRSSSKDRQRSCMPIWRSLMSTTTVAQPQREERLSVEPLGGDVRHKPANENDHRDEVEESAITLYHNVYRNKYTPPDLRHITRSEIAHSSSMPDDEDKVGDLTFNRGDVLDIDGTVFRGQFNRRPVAVKRIPLDKHRRIEQQLDLMREADDHPNIARLFYSTKDHEFHYIAFSSFEGTLEEYRNQLTPKQLDWVKVFEQLLGGLLHLHSLKIVLNDMSLETILLSTPDDRGQRRLTISGFEYAKKIPRGTQGSELEALCKKDTKGVKSIMVWANGLIFGLEKEDLHHLRLRMHLIENISVHQVWTYDSLDELQKHPYYWTPKKHLDFLQEVSDRIQNEPLDGPIMKELERASMDECNMDEWITERQHNMDRFNWFDYITELLRTYLRDPKRKRCKYDGFRVQSLLRLIRNLKHHYKDKDVPEVIWKELGSPPDDFLSYFTSRFPHLLLHTYEAMSTCAQEKLFQDYYPKRYRPCSLYRVTKFGRYARKIRIEERMQFLIACYPIDEVEECDPLAPWRQEWETGSSMGGRK